MLEAVRSAALAVDVDPLLAHFLRDLPLVGHGLLVEPHPLLRDGALLRDDLLLVEDDVVLLLRDPGRSVALSTFASVIGSRSN